MPVRPQRRTTLPTFCGLRHRGRGLHVAQAMRCRDFAGYRGTSKVLLERTPRKGITPLDPRKCISYQREEILHELQILYECIAKKCVQLTLN